MRRRPRGAGRKTYTTLLGAGLAAMETSAFLATARWSRTRTRWRRCLAEINAFLRQTCCRLRGTSKSPGFAPRPRPFSSWCGLLFSTGGALIPYQAARHPTSWHGRAFDLWWNGASKTKSTRPHAGHADLIASDACMGIENRRVGRERIRGSAKIWLSRRPTSTISNGYIVESGSTPLEASAGHASSSKPGAGNLVLRCLFDVRDSWCAAHFVSRRMHQNQKIPPRWLPRTERSQSPNGWAQPASLPDANRTMDPSSNQGHDAKFGTSSTT